jgi:hypothetical protein
MSDEVHGEPDYLEVLKDLDARRAALRAECALLDAGIAAVQRILRSDGKRKKEPNAKLKGGRTKTRKRR